MIISIQDEELFYSAVSKSDNVSFSIHPSNSMVQKTYVTRQLLVTGVHRFHCIIVNVFGDPRTFRLPPLSGKILTKCLEH